MTKDSSIYSPFVWSPTNPDKNTQLFNCLVFHCVHQLAASFVCCLGLMLVYSGFIGVFWLLIPAGNGVDESTAQVP